MTTVRPARPRFRPIMADAALVLGSLVSLASLILGIVWWPIVDITLTYPIATLLGLLVAVRIGAWSPLPDLWRFTLGSGVVSAGIAAYLLVLTAPMDSVLEAPAFFGAAPVLVVGYGIIVGALARMAVLLVRSLV